MIDSALINEILKRADIVDVVSHYINVIKKGRNYIALCPFHDDKNPSMMLSREKQIFKCFVCGTGGNVFTFVQQYEKISYIEAVKKVAELIGFNDERLNEYKTAKKVDVSLEPLHKCINDLVAYYEYGLSTEEGTEAYEYLNKRNLGNDIQKEYHLGYAFKNGKMSVDYLKSKGHSLKTIEALGFAGDLSGNFNDKNAGRVIFPIADSNGQTIGFSARKLTNTKDDTPKYVNTSETTLFKKNNVLFNYHIAKNSAKHDGYVYVLEGFMDVFALRKIGITSCVALMGTALTNNHINLLRHLGVEIRMCLDGDMPGQMATMKCCKMLDEANLPYRVVLSKNDTRDPDEILNGSSNGKEELKAYLNCLVDKGTFALQYLSSSKNLSNFKDKESLINEFIPLIIRLENKLEIENYIVNLSKLTGFEISTIKEIYNEAKQKDKVNEETIFKVNDYRPVKKALKRYEMAERAIVYQMMHSNEAIKYFDEHCNQYFYDMIYQTIADYTREIYDECGNISENLVIARIDQCEDENQAKVLRDVALDLSYEKHHPEYSDNVLDDLIRVLNEESYKMERKIALTKAIEGKTPQEQARIIDDINHKKSKGE